MSINDLKKKELAKKFCPILRVDKKAIYTPTNFIELFREENGEIDFTGSKPVLKWKQKAKHDDKTGLYWFAPAIFVHFLENIDIEIAYKKQHIPLVIQYLYYFASSTFYWGSIRVSFVSHPHDWEVIMVALDNQGNDNNFRVKSYSISAHGNYIVI
ncbi:MAG: NPP1 family protein, partial [Promethearchaeota archaeon]